MARVTVEDCILKVPNRFELVLLSAQRARDISAGAVETVERDNDKAPVVALREIAEDTLDLDSLQNSLIRGMQKHAIFEDDDEEEDAGLILTSDGEVEVPVKAVKAVKDAAGDAAGAEDGGK